MYFTICSSLCPWRSMARSSLRRSSARPALESAMVWFWQTRQRSSDAMRSMRASITGSAAAGGASLAGNADDSSASRTSRKALAIEEGLHHRLDARLDHLWRERPDVLHADDAALVDEERLGHAVHAEVDADAPVLIEGRDVVRIAELVEPAETFRPRVLVVEPDDGHEALPRQVEQRRMLLAARHAPRRPHVEQPHLAEHVVARDGAAGV